MGERGQRYRVNFCSRGSDLPEQLVLHWPVERAVDLLRYRLAVDALHEKAAAETIPGLEHVAYDGCDDAGRHCRANYRGLGREFRVVIRPGIARRASAQN